MNDSTIANSIIGTLADDRVKLEQEIATVKAELARHERLELASEAALARQQMGSNHQAGGNVPPA